MERRGFEILVCVLGVKKGEVISKTDEIGLRAIEQPIHVHDPHATIMHLMGLDHLRVTFLHNGRSERATIVDGELVEEVLA